MNSVTLNYQPIRQETMSRRNLSFKSDDPTKKPVEMTEPEDELVLNSQMDEEQDVSETDAESMSEPKVAEEKQPKLQAKTEKRRKFNIENAWKQFGAGLIAPVKRIVDHGVSGVVTAAVTGAASIFALSTKLGKKLSPFLMIAFVATGAVKIVKGIYDIASNTKDPEKQEKAFHGIGLGTTSITLAIAGSKKALKAADPKAPTKGMGYLKAFGQIIKRSREFAGNVLKELEKPMNATKTAARASKGAGTAAGITTAETGGNLSPQQDVSTLQAATGAATDHLMQRNDKSEIHKEDFMD